MEIHSTSSPPVTSHFGFTPAEDVMEAMCRFDAAHHGTTEPNENLAVASPDLAEEMDPTAIRAAHADDLVDFLQRWSEDLDARSARLHADIATHERRERAFRLWMQNRRLELEAQLAEYQQAQSRAEAAARRFAMSNPA